MTRIIYKDVAPGAKENATPSMADIQPFCDVTDLTREISPLPIGTGELNQWILNGNYAGIPDSLAGAAVWSRSLSNENGRFAAPIVLTLELDDIFSSVGITFRFDPHGPDWCNDLNIKWYRDSSLLADINFAPNDWEYFCQKEVSNYNKLVVTFYGTAAPYRYLKLWDALYGMVRVFDGDELRGVNLFQAASVISEQLEINTLRFTLSSKDPVPFMFQRKQPLEVFNRDRLQGVHYITASKRTGESIYDIDAVDAKGLLEESYHVGGIYNNITFSDLVREIIGNYTCKIDPALTSLALSGWLPSDTRRNNLAQAAFAAGAVVDTSGSHEIRIFAPPTISSSEFREGRMFEGASIETSALVTAVQVVEHRFATGGDTAVLFEGALSGAVEVTFGDPHHNLTIAGGTILESGANYAMISGTGAVVTLRGSAYLHTTKIVEIKNPNVSARDISNVITVENATLVSASNSSAVAQRVYDKYQRREIVAARLLLENEMPGDIVTIATKYDGNKTGTIQSLDLNLARKRTGDASILCT